MDPRYDDPGRSRTPGGHIPIPDAADPSQRPLYNRASSSSFQGFNPNQARFSHYDERPADQGYGINPEEYRRDSYHHQPYEPSPADIPLLPRDHRQEEFYQQPDNSYRQSHTSFQTGTTLAPEGVPTPTPSPGGQDDGSSQDHLHRGTAQAVRHLVYDCPVPSRLLKDVNHGEHDEFTHMRYTAATCDPEFFSSERFELRPQLYGQRRHTELFIVVTMYNEHDVLFARTMAGVFKNIEYMCSKLKGKHNGFWDKDGWKKIVVCVVNDGRAQLNVRTRAVMTALGCYQHGVGAEEVNKKPVTAHIYEYTTKVGIELQNGVVETRPGNGQPVQMIFCLKEKNQKKINSHRWALQAFGGALQPNVCVLLDAGTRPGKDSIYELWKAFDLDPMCGGACGEIKAMLGKGKGFEKLLNPLVAAQNFEYKMSNILDKPMESAFGFISVLPGAFSAYRFVALQNDAHEKGPLEKYFDGEKHHQDADIFTKNMYLAEDRILCFELVAKRKSSWVLTYVCSATGETDVPEEMPELVKQRRRWLNGSFFAAVYALAHFYQIFRSSHSMIRKIMFMIEFLYQLISMIFAWFAVGNFFLVFQILTTALAAPELLGKTGGILSVVIEWIYLGSLVICFVLSLGNTPDGSRRFYMTMVYSWGLIMMYLMFASIFISIKSVQVEAHDGKFTFSKLFTNSLFFTLIVSLLSTYVLWIFISLVFWDFGHIFHSSLQYLLLSPTYTNVINVYAFCNTHDVSWGTKGDDVKAEPMNKTTVGKDGKADDELKYDEAELNDLYASALSKFSTKHKEVPKEMSEEAKDIASRAGFRTYVVLVWMFCNAALVAVVLKAGGLARLSLTQPKVGESSQTVKIYLLIVLWSVAGLSGFKFVGAMFYKVKRIFKR